MVIQAGNGKKFFVPQERVIVPPRSISEQIYEVLKEQILLGQTPPGERMIESTTAETLRTSRTPVREAFQRLIQDGLVERVPQGGVRVTVVTPRMISEVHGIRAVLEAYAGELACDNIDPDTLQTLKLLSREARELLSSPETNQPEGMMRMWQLNTAFHETLCRAAGNGYLLRTLNGLKELVMRLRFLSLRKTRIRAWDQHDLMIGYIEKRDKEALAGLMRAHTELAAADALKALENSAWEKDV
jgi:GntR family transcriptional regulator, rspAB operon transcriptional repressor